MAEDQNPEQPTKSFPPDADAARRLSHEDATKNTAADSSRGIPGNAQHSKLPETFGRYRILRELGSGAMGVVYLARDTQLEREVALKIPLFGDGSSLVIDRFYREARSMAMLRHPNLCDIYDVGEIDGVHFLAMAYIKGRSLHEVLQQEKPLTSEEIAELIYKLAIALEEAHRAGVIHRDLKPSNIIVNQRNEPVIMDFGLARRDSQEESQLTKVGTLLGTPAYMSPEQVEGYHDIVGPASDTYSLGVIMFQLLCSRLPFEGSPAAVLGKILVMEAPRPSSLGVKVDSFLESVCMQAIAKRPEDRFMTAAAMASELQRALNGTEPKEAGPRVITQSEAAVAGTSFRLRAHKSPISSVSFSPDNRFALSGSYDGEIALWDLTEQTLVHQLEGHTDCVHGVSFSRNGSRAVSCAEDATLRLWDVMGGREIARLGAHQGISHQAKFAGKDDRWIVTAGPDNLVSVWDTATGKAQRQLERHRGFVLSVAVSPDGKRIASASNDRRVRMWDVQSGNEIPTKMRHQESVNSVAFTPDGRWLISAGEDSTIRVWDANSGLETRRFQDPTRPLVHMVLSRDGSKVLTGAKDGRVVLWDFESGTRQTVLDGHRTGVNCVALSSDTRSCLSGGVENDVVHWTL